MSLSDYNALTETEKLFIRKAHDYENEKLVKYFTEELKKFCIKNNFFMLRIDPYISLIERDNDGKVVVWTKNEN